MTNADGNNQEPGARSLVPDFAARRCERMLAFHAGALEEDEMALLRGRLESDPDWQRADADARKMLEGLAKDGAVEAAVPEGLAERAMTRVRSDPVSPSPRPSFTPSPHPAVAPSFFTPRVAAAIFAVCALPALWMVARYFAGGPSSESIVWRAEGELAAGAPFAPFLIVRDAQTQQPLPGVRLAATLTPSPSPGGRGEPVLIGDGDTGPTGIFDGKPWTVPDVPPGDYKLSVEARARSGAVLDRAERSVKVTRAARLALSPDRTQARPGETIRARALLVSSAGEKPMPDQAVTLDLFDPAGNRIGRAEMKSTRFGLAWAEFPLDSAAPEGAYKLKAAAAGLNAERSVEVKQYKLPPFRVSVAPDRTWFSLRDRISGKIEAKTFDGHTLAKAKGELRLTDSTGKILRRAEVMADAEGKAEFDLDAFGSPLPLGEGLRVRAGDLTRLRVDVALTDPAGRSASGSAQLAVGASPVVIHAVPEAGELVPGVENRVYIVVRGTDGAPVKTRLNVGRSGSPPRVGEGLGEGFATDEHGVAVFTLRDPKAPAEVMEISADYKNAPPQKISLPVRAREKGALLVRADKAVLKAGQALKVTVMAGTARTSPPAPLLRGEGGTVALALRQDGRTVATSGVQLKDGKGETTLTVPAGATGILSLEAALHFQGGPAWTDSRMIAIAGSENVRVVASADKPKYRPGERARLSFAVTDAGGGGVPAAVSVVAVDDALLALTGEYPGLAQALQAAGVNVFRRPDFPLDPAGFTPEQGGGAAALAALAGTDQSRARKQAAASESLIDTSLTRIAERNTWENDTRKGIAQWLWGLVAIGLCVLSVCAGIRNHTEAYLIVSLTTLGCALIGVLAAFFLNFPRAGMLVFMMLVALFASHVLLIRHAGKHDHKRGAFQTGLTILGDIALALLACVMLTQGSDRSANEMCLLLAVVAFGLAFCQFLAQMRFFLEAVVVGGFTLLLLGLVLSLLASIQSRKRVPPPTSAAFMVAEFNEEFQSLATALHSDNSTTLATRALSPRLRWDFPETMIFAPQIVTDEQGRASLEVPVADSLTSWRVQADAIAAAGGTGWTDTRLVVTQPFSVDITLPSDVTAGDVLYVPAVVSNHTETVRQVEVALKVSGATLLDGAARKLNVGAKSVAAVEFGLRFDTIGTAALTVTAEPLGGQAQRPAPLAESDAVQRTLAVLPDGEPVAFSASVLVGDSGELLVGVPDDALPGTVRASLRLHRGPLTQMLEGLESMLQEPHGCFEQTSSSTYPNIMILRYLKANGTSKPDIEQRAKDYIARGYQRLLGFEVGGRSGSFSLYGQAPASAFLTAYGLLEFTDMAQVYPVDPALLERMRAWLKPQMNADGSFKMDGYSVHERAPLGVAGTAYVVLALGNAAPRESIEYLRRNLDAIQKDAYLCALAANALLPHDHATAAQLAGKLRPLADARGSEREKGAGAALLPASRTLAWGYGDAAAVEASALGALSLLETGTEMDLAKQLLAGIQSRGGNRFGGWGSTHATVLALKALERASSAGRKAGPARIVVQVNGKPLAPIDLPAEESATPVSVPLELPRGAARVQVQVDGGPVAVRVVGTASVPWKATAGETPAVRSALSVDARYDATAVERGQAVLGTLNITAGARKAEVPMVEWGLAAGFAPAGEDLDALKARGALARWEISGRSLRLYLPDLNAGQSATFAVRFFATAKGELKGRAGRAYEYYRGGESAALTPGKFLVK